MLFFYYIPSCITFLFSHIYFLFFKVNPYYISVTQRRHLNYYYYYYSMKRSFVIFQLRKVSFHNSMPVNKYLSKWPKKIANLKIKFNKSFLNFCLRLKISCRWFFAVTLRITSFSRSDRQKLMCFKQNLLICVFYSLKDFVSRTLYFILWMLNRKFNVSTKFI